MSSSTKSVSTSSPEGRTIQRARASFIFLLCAAPLVALTVFGAPRLLDGLLVHLLETVLPSQLGTSVLVATGTVLAGTVLAAGGILAGFVRFPGHRWLWRIQLVPLLIPGWYLAVLYHHEQGLTGTGGLVLILGVSLAPLFQLLVTAALRGVPSRYLEVLRHLGRQDLLSLLRTLLPLALPAYAAAAVLVFFLAWADVASARTLAVPTVTVGLFDQWFGRQDDAAGAPLALALLALSLPPALAIWLWLTRGSFRPTARLQGDAMEPVPLHGAARLLPWLLSLPLVVVGVLYPAWIIVSWTIERLQWVDLTTLGMDLVDSLIVAAGCTAVAALLALALLQQQVAARVRSLTTLTTLLVLTAFAAPPLVTGLAWLWMLPEHRSLPWLNWFNDTPLPLVIALGLRHCAVFLLAGRAAMLRVARAHGDLARVLGRTGFVSFLRLFRPFIIGPMSAVAGLVFLAALQDLSISQVLQPFGFSTISTRVYQYAQQHRIPDCAVWILCQALVGVYPLSLLARWAESAPARRIPER